MKGFTNEGLFARATAVIPGGVNSPVRAFGSVGGVPYSVAHAEGPYVWDVEGHRFIDLVQSYGAIIVGHAHPAVIEAVGRAARGGTSFGAPTPGEVLLAEAIVERVPSIQKVRLVSSGTEATMSAVRLARGFTGRDRLVKFAGNYHGHSDAMLVEGGTAMASLRLAASAGVTGGAVADTSVVAYNEVPELDDEVACVIVEPVAANMGLVAPRPGFLEGLRAECDRVGAILIFDEVITGFRLARGGAQQVFGVRPDLTALGKVIGGGLPVGAFGGRAEIMDHLAPIGAVYQAGTLSGNPLATAAGLAVLGLLDDAAYTSLARSAAALGAGLRDAFASAGIAAQVTVCESLVGLCLADAPPGDYASAQRTDERLYACFFHEMLSRGVALAPGAFEVMFPGSAHGGDVIAAVVEAAGEAALAAARQV